jgi:hypothetical protein
MSISSFSNPIMFDPSDKEQRTYDRNRQTGDTASDFGESFSLQNAAKQQFLPDAELCSVSPHNRTPFGLEAESATDTSLQNFEQINVEQSVAGAVRSAFSLSVIQDIRPAPLDLFTPSHGRRHPKLVPESQPEYFPEEVDSTVDIFSENSGFPATASASRDSFEVIEETVSTCM